jgi:hypothetical protein
MRVLTQSEKRTIRLAAIAISIYLVFFVGWRGWRSLENTRSEYAELLANAQRLRRELRPYENRVLLTEKLKERYHLDPHKLPRATLVAEASAAIQRAAASGPIQLGPIRETAGRSSTRELSTMQLEGVGQVTAVMSLLARLETLGYPLVIDAIQLTPDAKPGMLKVHLTIVILDFEQWKAEEVPNA